MDNRIPALTGGNYTEIKGWLKKWIQFYVLDAVK